MERRKQVWIKLRDLSPSTGSQTRQTGVKLLFKEKNSTKHTVTPSFILLVWFGFLHFINAHSCERNKDNLERFYEMCLQFIIAS